MEPLLDPSRHSSVTQNSCPTTHGSIAAKMCTYITFLITLLLLVQNAYSVAPPLQPRQQAAGCSDISSALFKLRSLDTSSRVSTACSSLLSYTKATEVVRTTVTATRPSTVATVTRTSTRRRTLGTVCREVRRFWLTTVLQSTVMLVSTTQTTVHSSIQAQGILYDRLLTPPRNS